MNGVNFADSFNKLGLILVRSPTVSWVGVYETQQFLNQAKSTVGLKHETQPTQVLTQVRGLVFQV
jgi:hypothetical protein